jgi:hypothetical protein
MNLLIVIDTKSKTYSCYSKTLKGAKSKITRFKKHYPYKIISCTIYDNHQAVYSV